MSTAAKTPNYNLSQVAGSDIPDWITDYTSDMKKIDEALKENADDIATVRPDEFSEESTYAAGDYCIKDNVMYKAKTAVEAGAFDISDWTATTIFDELSGLNQKMGTFDLINISGADFIGDIGAYTFDRSISQYDFLIIATYTTNGIHITYHVVAPRIANTDNNLSLPTENGNFHFHFSNDTTLYIDSRPSSMLIMKTAYGVKL